MVTLLAVSLQRTYARTPVKELKRRARAGDELAAALFKAVTYGHSLRSVLWFLIGLSSAGFFVYVSRSMPAWVALIMSIVLVWAGFVWLPTGRVTKIGEKTAGLVAPLLARIVYYLHGPIDRVVNIIRRLRPIHFHTGLYEKADLLDMLDRQHVQADNRIEQSELEIARYAMTFGDKQIGDFMTPRRVVKMVSVDDALGPILMTELHDSGYSRFPVYAGKEDDIVGILFMRDLVNRRSGGKVSAAMKKQVLYLHEEQSLLDALQAVLKTRNHLYIVVNSFEEYVGIISMEDVLEQIVGKQIMDEFDQYENMRAVAERVARKEHDKHIAWEKEAPEAVTLESELKEDSATTMETVHPEIITPANKKHTPEVDDTIEID